MDTSESGTAPAAEEADPSPQDRPRRGWRRWALDTRPLPRPAYRRLWGPALRPALGHQPTSAPLPNEQAYVCASSL